MDSEAGPPPSAALGRARAGSASECKGSTRREIIRVPFAALGVIALTPIGFSCAARSGPFHDLRGSNPEDYMRIAIAVAMSDILRFGALVVDSKTGKITGVGQNRSASSPLHHAEIVAIEDHLERIGCFGSLEQAIFGLRTSVLYTTAEPCAMCMGAVAWARIPALYYGSAIPFLIENGHWQIDVRAEAIAQATNFERPRIIGGVLEHECNALYARP